MEKQNFNELISKAKSSNQKKIIQKIVPVSIKETQVQFSFYIEKELLRKIKMTALNNESSIKTIIINALKNHLKTN
jgi:predicted HicB family RNase H-like nuclease